MSCEYCLQITGDHDYHCPNFSPRKTGCYCSICGEEIIDGEEFLENIDGETIHFDCVQSIRSLLEWIGYEIKTMEEIR